MKHLILSSPLALSFSPAEDPVSNESPDQTSAPDPPSSDAIVQHSPPHAPSSPSLPPASITSTAPVEVKNAAPESEEHALPPPHLPDASSGPTSPSLHHPPSPPAPPPTVSATLDFVIDKQGEQAQNSTETSTFPETAPTQATEPSSSAGHTEDSTSAEQPAELHAEAPPQSSASHAPVVASSTSEGQPESAHINPELADLSASEANGSLSSLPSSSAFSSSASLSRAGLLPTPERQGSLLLALGVHGAWPPVPMSTTAPTLSEVPRELTPTPSASASVLGGERSEQQPQPGFVSLGRDHVLGASADTGRDATRPFSPPPNCRVFIGMNRICVALHAQCLLRIHVLILYFYPLSMHACTGNLASERVKAEEMESIFAQYGKVIYTYIFIFSIPFIEIPTVDIERHS